MLFVETPARQADAIIVLGGESAGRPWRAAEIFHQGIAPIVIVSGTGDCYQSADRLRLTGIPDDRILIECDSKNTRQNAHFSVKLLRNRVKAKSAVIVTTWWHSRRALTCFRKVAPEISFYSMPEYQGPSMWKKPSAWEWVLVLQEYVKLGYYAIAYSIW